MTTPTATRSPTAGEKVQQAVDERESTDYICHFWTAFGWTVLTFGLYAFYVFYRLMRRSRDHNRRRVTLLLAAQELAQQRSVEQGKVEALRPAFEQVEAEVQSLRAIRRLPRPDDLAAVQPRRRRPGLARRSRSARPGPGPA